MHSIIDVVAWPYATTFCLSADLMKIQVRTLVILFTLLLNCGMALRHNILSV
jgi:hypothetical protein